MPASSKNKDGLYHGLRVIFILFAFLGVASESGAVSAKVRRYALIIGNNRGDFGDHNLRHAERDALRIQQVLEQLGGFSSARSRLVLGQDSTNLRRALEQLEYQIRSEQKDGDRAFLLFYYSGHADADSLHLGRSRYSMSELRSKMANSSASLRVVITDACRSLPATRIKGGRPAPPFEVSIEAELPGQGAIYLHASAPGEQSQESDELQASFFTHYLVSGLRGAADIDGDAKVVLREAFQYAREQTLRTSSLSQAGTQHPAYNYNLEGNRDLVLTNLLAQSPHLARITVPSEVELLLFRENRHGEVVGEVVSHRKSRSLVVRPGKHFVRVRVDSRLFEGTVDLKSGDDKILQLDQLEEKRASTWNHKGVARRDVHHRISGAYRMESSPWQNVFPSHGVAAYYGIGLSQVVLQLGLGWTRGAFLAPHHRLILDNLAVELGVGHESIFRRLRLMFGVYGGYSVLHQGIRFREIAASMPGLNVSSSSLGVQHRWISSAQVGLSLQLGVELNRGFSLRMWLDPQVRIFREQVFGNTLRRIAFVVRPQLGLMKTF